MNEPTGPQPCHWYDDGHGGRYLIPGCIARINNPDLDECTCKTIQQQLADAREQIADLTRTGRSLQAWHDHIVRAVYDHPDALKIMKTAADKATPPAPSNA